MSTWARGGQYWIECETHTIGKIIITERGPVGEVKIPRVVYEAWRKPANKGDQPIRLPGNHPTADLAKAAVEEDLAAMHRAATATDAARQRRDTALASVAENAGDAWVEDAARYIRAHAERSQSPFLVEDVIEHWNAANKPRPHDPRAWGAAVQRAKRLGWIVRVGYAPAKTSNMSPKPLWRHAA